MLLIPMRVTSFLDPDMREKEGFFFDAFNPPPPAELDALPAVPVDKSSCVGIEEALAGEDDNEE